MLKNNIPVISLNSVNIVKKKNEIIAFKNDAEKVILTKVRKKPKVKAQVQIMIDR